MSSDHPVLRDCYKNWWRSEEDADAMMGAKIVLEGKECLGLGLGPAARAGLGGFERVRAAGRPGPDHNVLEVLYVFPTEAALGDRHSWLNRVH